LTGPGRFEGEKGGGEGGLIGMDGEDGRGGGGGGGGFSGSGDDSGSSLAVLIASSDSSIHRYSKLSDGGEALPLHRTDNAGGGCEEAIVAREEINAEGEISCVFFRPKPPRDRGSERISETR
jgi:hypothetical protein